MSRPSATYGSFTITRDFGAPVSLVFQAFADKTAKSRWFSAPTEWKDVIREQNFRVGGRDELKGQWPDGHISDFNAQYQDIVTDKRIVYVYDMHIDGVKISVSLATVEFMPSGNGTRLIVTEQSVFLDGYDDVGSREQGTSVLLDRLGASLDGKIL